MSSDKVLDIGFKTDWPERFYLDLVEKPLLGPTLELRNGAYRFVRVELFDDGRPGSPPLKTNMDKLDSETLLVPFGINQVKGARAGFFTQGGFLERYGAAPKPIPLPDLGLVKRYRVEVVGPAWDDILGGAPVPEAYHQQRTVMGYLELDDWETLTGATVIIEYVVALFILAFDLHMLQEDEAYLRGFGESWRNIETSKLPEGPNATVALGMIVFRFATGNTPQNTAAAVIYDVTKAFIELLVAPDPTLAMLGPKWAIPTHLVQRVQGAVIRAREKLLKRLLKHNLAKVVAKANVYVKVAGIAVDSGEFYAHYQSLNAVGTVSNALVDLRKDKTLLGLDPEPRTVATGEHFGLAGARFAWYRLPVTGTSQRKPELTFVDLTDTPVTAMVHIEPSNLEAVFVTDIVANGTDPLPLSLYVAPNVLDGDISYPGVEPDGRLEIHQRVELSSGLEPLFTAQRATSGFLNIDIDNDDHLEQFPHLASFTTIRQTQITVENRPPTITLPETFEIQVGEKKHLSFTIRLPNGLAFDSTTQFQAYVEERGYGQELVLSSLRLPKTDPWTGEQKPFDLPFDIVLRLANDDGELTINTAPGDHARFRVPESQGYADGLETYTLSDFLEGKSVGLSRLEVHLEGLVADSIYADYTDANRPHLQFAVSPTEVQLELIPIDDPEGQNRLIIEGDEPGEPMIGHFYLQARALDQQLFDSNQELFVVGTQDTDSIMLYEMYTQSPDGEFERLPFRLLLILYDYGQVATLNISGFGSNFQGTTDLKDVLRAAGPGNTTLEAKLLPLPDAEQEDHVTYSLPEKQLLSVEVPPPLVVELDRWVDELGDNTITGSTPTRELIHEQGTLHGRIVNHRPGSEVEVITLTHDGQEIDLWNELDDDGEFSIARTMSLGDNAVDILATKPINTLVNAPETGSVTLVGAAPQANGFPTFEIPQDPATLTYYIKEHRSVGLSARYARATSADVVDIIPGHPEDSIAAGLAQSYGEQIETGLSFMPDLVAEFHELTLSAHNDFDSRHHILTVQTVPRIVGQVDLIPQGFFKPGDPSNVGFDTTQIELEFLVECASWARVLNTTIGSGEIVRNLGPEFARAVIETVDLVVGVNVITLTAENDYGAASTSVIVTRRADIWSRTSGQLSVTTSDFDKRINVDFYNGSNVVGGSDDVTTDSFALPDEDAAEIADLLTHKFSWFNRNEQMSCFVSCSGTLTGPNFQEATLCFFRPDIAVDTSSLFNNVIADPDLLPTPAPDGIGQDVWDAFRQGLFDGKLYTLMVSHPETTGSGDPIPILPLVTAEGAS